MGLGTIASIFTADKAQKAQQHAADQANDTQVSQFEETRNDQQPWRDAGSAALNQMQNGDFQKDFSMADFQADPGYQFRMDEGQKALERSAAAKGGLMSGGTLKALDRYSQGVASDEYSNAYNRFNADRDRRFNRLSSLAGTGQTATNFTDSAGEGMANAVSGNQIGMGNATAAKWIAQGNAVEKMDEQNKNMMTSMAGIAMCDERLKTDIEPVSKTDLSEMKSHLKAYKFKYTDEAYGKGEYVGVMTQDLAKSKLGRTLIQEDKNGFMQVDLKRVLMLFLATMAEA